MKVELPSLPPDWVLLTDERQPEKGAPVFLIDPVNMETGTLLEGLELFLYELRRGYPDSTVGIHITGWLMGLAYGEGWGADFLLYHSPAFERLWGILPEGEKLPAVQGWQPPSGWEILSGSYRPTFSVVARVNGYLAALRAFRRHLEGFQPQQSTLYRTVAGGGIFVHLTETDIHEHVADLRR